MVMISFINVKLVFFILFDVSIYCDSRLCVFSCWISVSNRIGIIGCCRIWSFVISVCVIDKNSVFIYRFSCIFIVSVIDISIEDICKICSSCSIRIIIY